MRYRKLTADGDYSFGQGNANFWINVPAAVAQAVKTRLLLILGEWFLDTTDGTNYQGKILGKGTASTRDLEIKSRVLKTPGVIQLLGYQSNVVGRDFSAQTLVQTVYGQSEIVEITPP